MPMTSASAYPSSRNCNLKPLSAGHPLALTQMQIIQSLGEAMAWFEREINWDVPPTELRHLCGRIGELYAALITNGQMATEVNQMGYDVVGSDGERISVKTTASMTASGHVAFNSNSLKLVDQVMVLRINTEEMQIEVLLNAPVSDAINLMSAENKGKRSLALSKLIKSSVKRHDVKTVNEVFFQGYIIRELETGSIEVERDGVSISPVKPVLRKLADQLHVALLNSNGNALNTRQLGSQVIKSIKELQS